MDYVNNNLHKLTMAFVEGLRIKEEVVKDDLTYQSIKQWDSVGHMAMITEIESAFDIMMDTDDIIDMGSFAKAKEIIQKYGIDIKV
jgi:acyl carrier protein